MNKIAIILLIGVIAICCIFLALIGLNIFGVAFSIFFSVVYIAFVAGGVNGRINAKRDMYLANKYDEEYGNKKKK